MNKRGWRKVKLNVPDKENDKERGKKYHFNKKKMIEKNKKNTAE